MILLDGKNTAADIRAGLKLRAATFEEKSGRRVGLAVVCIGDDPASMVYIRNKVKACEEVGISSILHLLPSDTAQEKAEELVEGLASDENVDGILVQLPLPHGLNERAVLSKIPPEKDVDGFSEYNIGLLSLNRSGTVACTPLGIMELLRRYGVEIAGKHAVVVGRSSIVGRPMAMLLLNADATVTVCHSKTMDLAAFTRTADILIVAAGRAHLITADMVKEGAVVVDVGTNRDANGRLCGDVDFEGVKERALMISPVPGGVGPMTIAMLLKNTVDAAERSLK